MKIIKKHKYAILSLLALGVITFSCMTIESIIMPDNPKANSEIEVVVNCKFVTETDAITRMVFAVLAPKSWHLADNASLSLTTTGYNFQGGTDLTDEPMVLMESSEHEPTTDLEWSKCYQSKFGVMGNTGPVEWVVFRSQTQFIINDKVSTEPMTGKVKIKIKTGPENIKFFFGVGFCGMQKGFNSEAYKSNETTKIMEVTGGSGAKLDYTVVSLVSTIPSVFRYGDIFSVQFLSEVGTTTTALKGVDKVYLCGKVVLSDGRTVVVDKASANNLMEKNGSVSYQKYIYPKHFFGLQPSDEIVDAYFYFINEDKSLVVTSGNDGFQLTQSDK